MPVGLGAQVLLQYAEQMSRLSSLLRPAPFALPALSASPALSLMPRACAAVGHVQRAGRAGGRARKAALREHHVAGGRGVARGQGAAAEPARLRAVVHRPERQRQVDGGVHAGARAGGARPS